MRGGRGGGSEGGGGRTPEGKRGVAGGVLKLLLVQVTPNGFKFNYCFGESTA